MSYLTRFEHHIAHIDKPMNTPDKVEWAECARLLAMNVAHYPMGYGELSLDKTLAVAVTDAPTPINEQLELTAGR